MQPLEGRFAGRTVVVTGAGAGIGHATASRLMREGARVVASDIAQDRLAALEAESPRGALVTVAGDISAEETVQRIVSACAGRIDALANNAGIMDGFLPAAEIDDATWEKVFAVNVTAVMRLTRAFLPLMIAAGRGSIVNVASEAALRGSAAGVAYTASKHALIGFTKNTAFMYGAKGVRVNIVAPGPVRTSISGASRSDHGWSRIAPVMNVLAVPVAESATLAGHILWLMSDEAENINGAVLPSDGGWSTF
ncbi:SDR family NAD(P)-dependent oxidoreductase [Stigmatella aurantiaca]|uniref:Levodione reductase ((6R)-2,2,6-trimethyl-1,4-cyclohexanedione reductase) n=1 Tax=Stigmatella aurantiaca (strain DW4/3-1) TaxID=378806 RepID=Q08W79_STIAD|nr:SDR family NAD(P)-dependent oxidoreductase [Stigmatella aurantiaca]ADO71760.1 Levodione reductase ((6R)-2,2,6-trimethyl-1,4-cyclohexanedione reductase) [Stigmatella aurantiaca DW4/3-1]EAU64745.1 levodione reductase ((6R)-2,2,6-trimethyl-1,4-cyclohexanedione reductase) [Stigmatella aurantiaca DW4/3-1]